MLIVAAWVWRPALLVGWVISFMVFPMARLSLGGAPIYLFDVAMVGGLSLLWATGDLKRWSSKVPPWHWIFVGSAFVLSVMFGTIRYGFSLEIIWIWAHSALAWMGFAIGTTLVLSERRSGYQLGIQAGLLASAVALCAIAVIQYADLEATAWITRFFYGGLGNEDSVEMLRIGALTNRANGPHFAPTSFAGIVVLAWAVFFLVSEPEQIGRRMMMFILSAVTILCTVSRHAMLAAALGVAVTILFAEHRTRIRLIGLCAAVIALGMVAGGALLHESWNARMSRFDEGVLEDDNIAARVLWGPERLADFFTSNPSMIMTGAGIDPEKLLSRAGINSDFEGGFVSNGFLLALYYLGAPGFLLYLLFWVWASRIAWSFPLQTRGPMCGLVIICMTIVAADNYSFMYEPAATLLFMIVGLMAGKRQASLFADDEEEQEEIELEESYVAQGRVLQ